MRKAILLLLVLTGCQTPQPAAPEEVPIIATPAAPGGGKTVQLEPRTGFPGLSISIPPGWQHQFAQGIDTRIHTLAGGGASVTIELWPWEGTYCRSASCGLVRMPVGQRYADIFRRTATDIGAFIPVEAGPEGVRPRRGVRFGARCSSVASCDEALAVLASIQFS